MTADQAFGDWLRQKRRALDLTQEELAGQVGCSAITLRKLEAEERRPSKQIAERLAQALNVPPDGRADFLRFARGDPFAAPAGSPPNQQPEPPKAPRHNLPSLLTRFIGREREIGEIRALLGNERLVTLTGTGGTGKTRLAQQVASGLLDALALPDGLWLVELAPLTEPALLPQIVAAGLGLREKSGLTITAMLIEYLRARQTLLLLDNCEHLIQACAELAETLLRACPRLTILATSREGLGLTGESTYPVRSLSLPDASQGDSLDSLNQSEAARLFVARATAALPTFALTRDNAQAVAAVCRRLDGIPLAIELAAARVNVLGIEQLVALLDDRFRLLTGGSRAALPRHQTLQALIDWSYDLLSEPERILFQRLAVFASGWTLEAAEAVGAGERIPAGEVFNLLRRLIDKSLVQVDTLAAGGGAWYRLLETVRQYALAKLAASEEAETLQRRHAAHYLALYEKGLPGQGSASEAPRAWIDIAERELGNFRAALAWSQSPVGDAELGLRLSGIMPYMLVGYAERRRWLEAATARVDAGQADYPQARAQVLRLLSQMDAWLGDYAGAQAHLAQSLTLFRQLGDRTACAGVLERLAWLAREQGDTTTARLRLAEALPLQRELGHQVGLARTLNTLGQVALMQGDTAEAAQVLTEALALNRQLAITDGIGWSLNHLGQLAQLQGDTALARRLHEESLVQFEGLHHQYHGVGEANQSLGETALARGDATFAMQHFLEALELFQFLGARAQQAWCLAGLAGAAVLDEEPERAARLWGAAEALRRSIGARHAPAARATRERLMAAAREQIGAAAFDAAWAEGESMTAEQAIEMALEAGD